MTTELLYAIRRSKVYDLAQPYFVGMPHFPTHPPFLFGLTKKHGDYVAETGMSSAADSIALGSHVGTHIDALCHFSCGGKLHGGVDVAAVQSDGGGIGELSVDTIVLLTGWARFWNDASRYITGGKGTQAAGPGPEIEGARWLSKHGVFAVGSDTVAFEKVPAPTMPVHVHLLVESGIHIIEALNLEELSRDRIYEFVLVATPLKIRGGTGSPIRPLALA